LSERLTDAQVAAHIAWLEAYLEDGIPNRLADQGKTGLALALEVQQARGRRCGNCERWILPLGNDEYGICAKGVRQGGEYGYKLPATWSCADFTPKDAK
jgi:hypothetical protein